MLPHEALACCCPPLFICSADLKVKKRLPDQTDLLMISIALNHSRTLLILSSTSAHAQVLHRFARAQSGAANFNCFCTPWLQPLVLRLCGTKTRSSLLLIRFSWCRCLASHADPDAEVSLLAMRPAWPMSKFDSKCVGCRCEAHGKEDCSLLRLPRCQEAGRSTTRAVRP